MSNVRDQRRAIEKDLPHRDVQLIDAFHLRNIVAERLEVIKMLPTSHLKLAAEHHPEGIVPRQLSGVTAKSDCGILRVAMPWLKPFGWRLGATLDGHEQVLHDPLGEDVREVFFAYLRRHDITMWSLVKGRMKGHGSAVQHFLAPSSAEVRDLRLNVFIRAVEVLDGHVFVRRPKRGHIL